MRPTPRSPELRPRMLLKIRSRALQIWSCGQQTTDTAHKVME